MNRKSCHVECPYENLPHARGDEPNKDGPPGRMLLNLPHARGDEPIDYIYCLVLILIYPTHVGMNRMYILCMS